MKPNYLVIPLVVFLTAFAGSLITSGGLEAWYQTINLPPWTPSGPIIGAAWTIIFILSAISALIVWNKFPRGEQFKRIICTFIANAFLNVLWSYLFFGKHLLSWAVLGAASLFFSVALLIALIRPNSKFAVMLLYPYAIWVLFATYLTFIVWTLN